MGFDWQSAAGFSIGEVVGEIPTISYFDGWLPSLCISLRGIHRNPKFFKYKWQIWTREEAAPDEVRWMIDGDAVWLNSVPERPFLEAMQYMKLLVAREERFIALHHRYKRDDPDLWNVEVIRRTRILAPAYALDSDPDFFGHR
jgi:hypothetical protein